MPVGLILLDLDGTLLNGDKQISPVTYAALERAVEQGVHIVPCTGRAYGTMPELVRRLPFVRYFITCNGANVYDRAEDKDIYRAEIPVERAMELFDFMDGLPVIYDCFLGGTAYMERQFYERIERFISVPHDREMVKTTRRPVDGFKEFIRTQGRDVQKTQIFFADPTLRDERLPHLQAMFPDLLLTTALVNNIEFNVPGASKGAALKALAAHLGVAVADTMAFGDMTNDASMIRAAGLGVAMGNATPALKEIADFVTDTNDEDGVAKALEKFVFV